MIRNTAHRLSRLPRFGPSDREDLAQDLTAALLAKARLYDPRRGASVNTFATRVIESEALMIQRSRRRLKRAAGFTARSLDRDSQITGGRPVPLAEVIADDDRARLTGTAPARGLSPADAAVLAAAVDAMPTFLKSVAQSLIRGTAAGAARDLGISRRQVRAAIQQIRERLAAAGLDPE